NQATSAMGEKLKEDRIKSLENEVSALQKEIKALKAELDLHWETDLKKQQEIQELQKKQHQEVMKKQEEGFYRQKMMGLLAFAGILITVIGAFIAVIKKLKEAKKEIRELLKK
ncbi:26595_t:CDS:2, partial [Racocetra persica]